jgi:hypothetical protein
MDGAILRAEAFAKVNRAAAWVGRIGASGANTAPCRFARTSDEPGQKPCSQGIKAHTSLSCLHACALCTITAEKGCRPAMHSTTHGHVALQKSTSKLLGLVALTGVLVLISIWAILDGPSDTGGKTPVVIGWAGAIFFGLALLLFLYRLLFWPRYPIELTPQGFVDRRKQERHVPWSAVTRLSVGYFGYAGATSMLRIHLVDRAVFGPVGTVGKSMHRSLGGTEIVITSSEVDLSFPDLCKVFGRYLKDRNPAAIDDTWV